MFSWFSWVYLHKKYRFIFAFMQQQILEKLKWCLFNNIKNTDRIYHHVNLTSSDIKIMAAINNHVIDSIR